MPDYLEYVALSRLYRDRLRQGRAEMLSFGIKERSLKTSAAAFVLGIGKSSRIFSKGKSAPTTMLSCSICEPGFTRRAMENGEEHFLDTLARMLDSVPEDAAAHVHYKKYLGGAEFIIVDNPDNAPLAIFSFILTPLGLSNLDETSKATAIMRGLSDADQTVNKGDREESDIELSQGMNGIILSYFH
ncbi:killer toxin alpha/beta [Trichophyton rubrum]|uniref:Killer toxin alpha/beta n=1 Tax=Trichophyton rubrum TaxID=5551 RepID=A0A178EW44_TRIRU|nr:killer toxin alpha/beta [Trichophyton rubrum]